MPRIKKRVLTHARREQNRVAQRAYRKRQSDIKKSSKEGASRRPRCPPSLEPRPGPPGSVKTSAESRSPLHHVHSGGRSAISQTNNHSVSYHGVESPDHALDQMPSPPGLLFNPDGVSSDSNTNHEPPPANASQENRTLTLETWNPSPSGSSISTQPSIATPLPSPYLNCLQSFPTVVFGALLQNAICMGFELERLVGCPTDYVSPFYRPDVTSMTDPTTLLTEVHSHSSISRLPIALRPTMAQVIVPHHASLDLIPLPEFRDRAIMLSAVMPRTVNLWELKSDIYQHGGLKVWQPGDRDGVASNCRPWDETTWEAASWFLEKWSLAIGGYQGALYRRSVWWKAVRGEREFLDVGTDDKFPDK